MLENAVVITGASQRIGAYLADKFLTETDYPVIFSYRTARPKVDELLGRGAIGIQADFTKAKELKNFIQEVKNQATSLRGMIHNASLWLDDSQENSFETQWQVHAAAPFELNSQLENLLTAGSGLKDIISITDAKLSKPTPTQIGYFASKAALQNMMLAFAQKFAPKIKVNDICPALIEFNEWDDEAYKQQRLAESLLPLEPKAEVIWQAVNYLFNSPYTTGSVLHLDGGRRLK